MNTLFISDLHLQSSQSKIINVFIKFLQQQATQADAVYILGDLFEAWVGDDDNNPLAQQVKKALKALSQTVPTYFMRGNRDFTIGERFSQEAGITLLADPTVIELYGRRVLLMHGDLLCTDDLAYQAFRRKVYAPNFIKRLMRLPLFVRRLIALWARYKSKKHTGNTDLTIQDVNQQETEKTMQEYKVNILIHGHTHRPTIHDLQINGQGAKRIVLAAWHDQGYVLQVSSTWEISSFELPTTLEK